jgi:hypothetical protein
MRNFQTYDHLIFDIQDRIELFEYITYIADVKNYNILFEMNEEFSIIS